MACGPSGVFHPIIRALIREKHIFVKASPGASWVGPFRESGTRHEFSRVSDLGADGLDPGVNDDLVAFRGDPATARPGVTWPGLQPEQWRSLLVFLGSWLGAPPSTFSKGDRRRSRQEKSVHGPDSQGPQASVSIKAAAAAAAADQLDFVSLDYDLGPNFDPFRQSQGLSSRERLQAEERA